MAEVKYMVSPPYEPEAWVLPAGEFRKHLVADFPEARIASFSACPRRSTDATTVDFRIAMPSCQLHGTYSADPPELRLEGDLPCCATLAIWFRGQVPIEQELVFANDA
jgi:hypothetical protein